MEFVKTTHKKILVLLTNEKSLRSNPNESDSEFLTGFDVKELAHVHQKIKEYCPKVVFDFVTPKGGLAPIDPTSLKDRTSDTILRKFIEDEGIMNDLKNTKSLDSIKESEYRVMIIPGGAGAVFDLPYAMKKHATLLDEIMKNCGMIATIGHGLSALMDVPRTTQSREFWITGKKVTCISKEEDQKLRLVEVLPFVPEEKVTQRHAKYEKAAPFTSKVVVDGRLVTAQNPQSIDAWIEKMFSL